MAEASIGVIGGSGIYAMEGLSDLEDVRLDTPFGEPSDAYAIGNLGGRRVAFLPRHGRGHRLTPSEVNYRANIYGFRLLGVERIFSASAVGSLRDEIVPLDVVVPDQFIDRTERKGLTFFGNGVVAHVSLADPFCPHLRRILMSKAREQGVRAHDGGTYLCIEGPQFSTRAESHMYRSWGVSVIGMTNVTEARLSREAEICYATIALVTDYDCWRTEDAPVTVEQVVARLESNAGVARGLIRGSIDALPDDRDCECGRALADAVLTDVHAAPPEAIERLRPILERRLKGR